MFFAAPVWQVQWPVTGSRVTFFVLVLVTTSIIDLWALKLYNATWYNTLYSTGNEACFQWLHLVCIFMLDSGNVKWKIKNEIRQDVMPVCARLFLLSVGCTVVPLYLIGRWWCEMRTTYWLMALILQEVEILPEVMLHMGFFGFGIAIQGDFGLISRKSIWAVFQNAPWAHAWLDVSLASN